MTCAASWSAGSFFQEWILCIQMTCNSPSPVMGSLQLTAPSTLNQLTPESKG